MWKHVFLFFLIGCSAKIFSQNFVSEYKTGARIWEFENGFLINYFTNTKVIQLDGFLIRDCSSGKVLYELTENHFSDKNKRILYSMKNDTLRDYDYGNLVYLMDAEYLVDGSTNTRLYRIEGTVPVEILVAAILQGLR